MEDVHDLHSIQPWEMFPYVLSSLTIICTIGMFMAGIPDCLIILKTGSTENVIFLPFLATNVNNILWFSYGYLKSDRTVMVVNGIGCCLQTCYMVIFMMYSPTRVKCLQRTVISCVGMVLLYLYMSNYVGDTHRIINQLGLVCCIITTLMYISPLTEIASVLRTKSTKGISLPLTITTFLASSLWVAYGVLVKDLYIQVPNVPGVLSSLFRIFLLWMFKDSGKV